MPYQLQLAYGWTSFAIKINTVAVTLLVPAIFLVTPETSEERIRQIDKLSSGFLYAVSSSSTTGSFQNTTDTHLQENYFSKLQQLNLTNPILVGFGIKAKASFDSFATLG